MSLARITTWADGNILTASALNGEFNNILSNPTSLISPATANWDLAGNTLIDAVFKNTPVVFASADTTPSVAGGTVFKTANLVPTTISFFDGGVAGQRIWVIIADANTTVDFSGTNLSGNGGADWVPSSGDMLHAVFISPTWYCSVSTSGASSVPWTPSVGGTATYGFQTGQSYKVGSLVFVYMSLGITLIGTGSTTTVTGLPYAGISYHQPLSVGYTSDLATAVVSVNAVVNPLSTSIAIFGRTAASVSYAAPDIFGNNTQVMVSGVYRIP